MSKYKAVILILALIAFSQACSSVALIYASVIKAKCRVISGLDTENAPIRSIIKTHIQGESFWELQVCPGNKFAYDSYDYAMNFKGEIHREESK